VRHVPTRAGLLLDGVWEDRERTLPVLDAWSGEELGV
jgi:hypothetical protein